MNDAPSALDHHAPDESIPHKLLLLFEIMRDRNVDAKQKDFISRIAEAKRV